MLPKKKRLNKELFSEINKGFKKVDTPLFLLKARFLVINQLPKFSCVVSKKVSKSAVSRNRLRRVFYEALRKNVPLAPRGAIFVFYLKPQSLNLEQKSFEAEIKTALKQLLESKNALKKGN